MRRLQRRRIFRVKTFPKIDIFQFRARDQFDGARSRRFTGEHLLHERIVCAELLGKVGQRIGQANNLVVVVNRLGREQIELERVLRAIAKRSNAFAVWLAAFIDRACKQTRILKQRAVERTRSTITDGDRALLLEIIVARRKLHQFSLRSLDSIVRAD